MPGLDIRPARVLYLGSVPWVNKTAAEVRMAAQGGHYARISTNPPPSGGARRLALATGKKSQ